MKMRALLRQSTAEHHIRLEREIERHDLLSNLDGYALWLSGTSRFCELVHDAVAHVASPLFAGNGHADARALIEQDLADLGARGLPSHSVPALDAKDALEALGIAYVAEGATLGAQIVGRRVQALGCSSTFGARYLTSQALKTARWRRLVSELDELEICESDQMRMVDASRRAFIAAAHCYGLEI